MFLTSNIIMSRQSPFFQSELVKEKSALDAQVAQKHAELAALQQELREDSETAIPADAASPLSLSVPAVEYDRARQSTQPTQPTQLGPARSASLSQTLSTQQVSLPDPALVAGSSAAPTGSKKRAKPTATSREKEMDTEIEPGAPKPAKTRASTSKKRKL